MTVVFVGSYSPEDQAGIRVLDVDADRGSIEEIGAVAGVRNPSFLAVHPGGKHLYAVAETGIASDGRHGTVHTFEIDAGDPGVTLTEIGSHSTLGDHPCHIAIDRDGRRLVVSNYSSGDVALFPIEPDASLRPAVSHVHHDGSGPHPRQAAPHAHSAIFLPGDRFLAVADLGIDRIMVYAVDADSGALSRHAEVAARPGAGPRHMAIHRDGKHLFAINELDLTVAVYDCDPSRGSLALRQVTPVADTAISAESLGADLHMTSVGDRLVVSVRGRDVLVSVAFDPDRGFGDVAEVAAGGSWPRGFCLLDDGRGAVVANRRSDEVSLVSVPGGSHPAGVIARHRVPEPSCVVSRPL